MFFVCFCLGLKTLKSQCEMWNWWKWNGKMWNSQQNKENKKIQLLTWDTSHVITIIGNYSNVLCSMSILPPTSARKYHSVVVSGQSVDYVWPSFAEPHWVGMSQVCRLQSQHLIHHTLCVCPDQACNCTVTGISVVTALCLSRITKTLTYNT